MPAITYATTTPFLMWLFRLLADRKQLKAIATKYRSQYLVNGQSPQTADAQEEIIDLVLSGVSDPNDQFRKISFDLFPRLLFGLLENLNQGWAWIDDLEAFWNSSPTAGLFHLEPAVQLRLLELTAPLDEVVAAAQDRFA
jgi:hypothetical protein